MTVVEPVEGQPENSSSAVALYVTLAHVALCIHARHCCLPQCGRMAGGSWQALIAHMSSSTDTKGKPAWLAGESPWLLSRRRPAVATSKLH